MNYRFMDSYIMVQIIYCQGEKTIYPQEGLTLKIIQKEQRQSIWFANFISYVIYTCLTCTQILSASFIAHIITFKHKYY